MSLVRTAAPLGIAITLTLGAVQPQSASTDPAAAHTTQPARWNLFRGPGSRGIAAPGTPFPVKFGPADKLLWKTPTDPGHSSPCVWDDRIFLTGGAAPKLSTLCIHRRTGEILWRREVAAPAPERVHRINSEASSTPATDGERVFVYFGPVGLVCYDFEGVELWRRPVPKARNIFGTAASPIVAGRHVILNRDTNDESFLECLDARTGTPVWKVDRKGFVSGWSTPVVWQNRVWQNGDTAELLVYGSFQLTAYDLATGAERWSVPGLADEPCITPVTGEGLVFVSSYNMRTNPEVLGIPEFAALLKDYDGDGSKTLSRAEAERNKSVLSRADADGEGDHPLRMFFRFLDRNKDGELDAAEWQGLTKWLEGFEHANALVAIRPGDGKREAEIRWQHGQGVPECPSPLYHRGRIYLVKNGGLATCLDAKTGKQLYQERIGARGPRYSSPVVGDDKIYTASARGVVTVLATGEQFRVLAHNDLGERIMATPALVDGKVYIRTAEHLYAFGPE